MVVNDDVISDLLPSHYNLFFIIGFDFKFWQISPRIFTMNSCQSFPNMNVALKE